MSRIADHLSRRAGTSNNNLSSTVRGEDFATHPTGMMSMTMEYQWGMMEVHDLVQCSKPPVLFKTSLTLVEKHPMASKHADLSDLIIIDDFLEASLLNSALEQLEQQGLAQFQDFQLPGLVNNGTGRRAKVQVPGHLVQKVHNALGMEEIGEIGPMAILPAMMSRGDVRSHRDVWNGRIVSSHTVIIWLSGAGSLILTEESALNQHVVDVKPGRLIAFNNCCFHHAVHGDLRAMLGPMALEGGEFRAVMDNAFRTPSDCTCWEKCCCCCFLCCLFPCLFMCVKGAGVILWTS